MSEAPSTPYCIHVTANVVGASSESVSTSWPWWMIVLLIAGTVLLTYLAICIRKRFTRKSSAASDKRFSDHQEHATKQAEKHRRIVYTLTLKEVIASSYKPNTLLTLAPSNKKPCQTVLLTDEPLLVPELAFVDGNQSPKEVEQEKEQEAEKPTLIITIGDDTTSTDVGLVVNFIRNSHPDPATLSSIVILIDCPGGEMSEYGLMHEHIRRLTDAGYYVHAIADKMVCSGGYLAVCSASRISAAPFSHVGSIGVLCQLPNVSGICSKLGVRLDTITSGEHKQVHDMFAEKQTDAERQYTQDRLKKKHNHFQTVVRRFRKIEDPAAAFDGTVFSGADALDIGLVDDIATSNEILGKITDAATVHYLFLCKSKDKLDSTSLFSKVIQWALATAGAPKAPISLARLVGTAAAHLIGPTYWKDII
jgi:signal peptide peptidase SppA